MRMGNSLQITRRGFVRLLSLIAGAPMFARAAVAEDAPLSTTSLLWYSRPAQRWVEALPIGNGRLGAMVFGGVVEERLQLNDDTLWSGGPKDWNNPKARSVLPEIRRAVFSGDSLAADRLAQQMMGPFTQSYQPLGDLTIVFEHGDVGREYRRELDLTTAIASVRYKVGDATFTRDVFASQPAQVIAIRLAVDRPGRLTFVARLSSLLRSSTDMVDRDIRLRGRAPAHVDPSYHDQDIPVVYDEGGGMRFEARLRAIARDGQTGVDSDGLHVDGRVRGPARPGRRHQLQWLRHVAGQRRTRRSRHRRAAAHERGKRVLGQPARGARCRPPVADAARDASTRLNVREGRLADGGAHRHAGRHPTRSWCGCCSTTAATS